jgi:rhodanese-related sulfurtransferase
MTFLGLILASASIWGQTSATPVKNAPKVMPKVVNQAPATKAATNPVTKAVAPVAKKPTALPAAKTVSKPKVEKKPAETAKNDPSCGARERRDYLELTPKNYFNLLDKGSLTLISLNAEICYIPGMTIKIFTSRSENGVLSESIYRGTVKIMTSQAYPFSKAKSDPRLLIAKDDLAELTIRVEKRAKRWPEYGDQVYVLNISKGQLAYFKKNYGAPKSHPMAKPVEKKQIMALLKAEKSVYDVRPPGFFKKHPLKGAINLTANDYRTISREIMTVSEMKKAQISFNKGLLPKDHNEEIYLLSACAGEYASYNFVTLIRDAGYKNVFWFRPGYFALAKNKPPCMVPANVSGVKKINAREVINMMADKDTKIIDIREGWAKEGFMIKNATKASFTQETNALGLADIRKDITLEKIKTKKEGFVGGVDSLGLAKTAKIIVYGQNEFDWGAYKAAMVLAANGYSNVYWYRLGMDDWKFHSLRDGKVYPLNQIVKREDLYL